MENQNESAEITPGHSIDRRDTTEAEGRSVVEPKIPTTINATREKRRDTNALQEDAARENKGILKETSASGSHAEEVDDTTERGDKSARESSEDAMTMRQVISADGTRRDSLRRESRSDEGSKRQMKSQEKIGVRRRQRRPFGDMVGKREQRRDELEKVEGDLRQRLDMLECSMPAVMAWNICRMTQGASPCTIKRILEKQFQAASELPSRNTPSRHYDCRVREVEAERKLALKKVEEARALWSEKLRTLEDRKKELDEARRIQEEQKNAMERLNEEIERLREAKEKAEAEDESCQYGECGDRQCKQRRRAKASTSVTSIQSGDIECLEKLQQLAEEELIIKKDIAELERREDAYMRTLQRTDELWSTVQDDVVSSTSALREQLETKTAANQQLADRVCELEDALEQCRTRMAACRTELEKFLSIEKLEAAIGRDDDVADVTDRAVAVRARVVHRPIGREDDVAMVKDDEVLARVEVADEITLARVEVTDEEVSAVITAIDADAETIFVGDDKYVSVKPESVDLAVDHQVDLVPVEEKESAIKPEDFDYEQQKVKEIKEYLAQLGSLEELYEDDGEACPPDFVCNGVVTSPTGMTDEELIAMGVEPTAATEEARKLAPNEEERKRREMAKITDEADRGPRVEIEEIAVEKVEGRVADDGPITTPEVRRFDADQDVVIKRDEVLSWIDKIDMIRTKIAKYPELRAVKKEADILAEQIGAHVGIKPKEVMVDEAEAKLDEDEIKHVPKVPTEVPEISPIEDTQVKSVISPDIITKTTEVDIEQAKLEDKLIVPEKEEMKLEPKIPSIPIPFSEEAPVEADLTKEEISIEPAKVVLIETPQVQKIEVDDETTRTTDEERFIVEEAKPKEQEIIPEHVERIEEKTELEIKEPSIQLAYLEETPTKADLEKEITADVEPAEAIAPPVHRIDEPMKPVEEKLILEKAKQKVEETISEYEERIEGKAEFEIKEPSAPFTDYEETPVEADLKEKITVAKPPETVPIKPQVQQIEANDEAIQPVDEKQLIEQVEDKEEEKIILDAEKIETEIEDMPKDEAIEREPEPPEEIIETEEVPPVTIETIEPAIVEEVAITVDEREVEKPTVDEVLPRVDLPEMEELKPSELPIVAEVPVAAEVPVVAEVSIIEEVPIISEVPIVAEIEETEALKQPVPEVEITKVKDKETEEAVEKVAPPVAPREEEDAELSLIKEEKLPAEVPVPAEPTVEVKRKEALLLEEKLYVFEAFKVDEKILILKAKVTESAEEATSTEPQPSAAKPYFVLDRRTKFEERELLRVIPEAMKPPPPPTATAGGSVTSRVPTSPSLEESAKEVEITTRSGVVQTELITIVGTQLPTAEGRAPSARIISEYFAPVELETSSEIASDRPEITGRKMLWRKRLKDQSTVTTTSAGSQTDKTSHVSHDRVARERARLTTDELLRSIKIAAGLTRGDTEREIRTINYGLRSDDETTSTRTAACNCCLCGDAASSTSTRGRSQIQPQVDARTTTPLTAVFKRAFAPLKTDHAIPHDKLCPDCKAKIQGKITRDKQRIERIVEKVSQDRESHTSSLSTGGSTLCRAVPRKKTIEKRDQCCLAKIPKRKTEVAEQRKKSDPPALTEETKEADVKPLTPSCTCFQLEKPSTGPMRKGNCYCAD